MDVLDANILIRGVLGSRVSEILRRYSERVEFMAPDTAFAEVRKHLPTVLTKRGIEIAPAMALLDLVGLLVRKVEPDVYRPYERVAKMRMSKRDVDDWPVLACALCMECPIWTEDNDFFGCGMATWTTDRIGLYLEELCKPNP